MKELKICHKIFLVDDEDFEWLNDLNWELAGKSREYAHIRKMRNYKTTEYYLHQIILFTIYGKSKVLENYSDHINRNTYDCQRKNLRLVTSQQNAWNRKRVKKAGIYTGVTFCPFDSKKNPWVARIRQGKRTKYLGWYNTPEKAAKAYDKECLKVRGKYAVLNFPQVGF